MLALLSVTTTTCILRSTGGGQIEDLTQVYCGRLLLGDPCVRSGTVQQPA